MRERRRWWKSEVINTRLMLSSERTMDAVAFVGTNASYRGQRRSGRTLICQCESIECLCQDRPIGSLAGCNFTASSYLKFVLRFCLCILPPIVRTIDLRIDERKGRNYKWSVDRYHQHQIAGNVDRERNQRRVKCRPFVPMRRMLA